jgi:predicted naringenin-chalcone synthase
MSTRIISIAKGVPKYSRETNDILPLLKVWLSDHDDRYQRKAKKIFENAGVDKRFSIMDPLEVFTTTSFEEKNRIYKSECTQLAETTALKALEQAQLNANDIDYIISVSCTGIMIPSIDAYLINRLGMRQDIVRLPVTEMGCVAGVSAMIYANSFLRANPNKRALIIAVESPTATFQLNDYSMANIVSAAIFGDGCACAVLSSYPDEIGPKIIGDAMYHFVDSEHMMGFDLTNSGLKMVLDKAVPETIAEHFPMIVEPFLAEHNLTIADVDHLIFHPGGKKIVNTIEELFGEKGKNIDNTKAILREYGNMSSATVLYVLERFMTQKPAPGDIGLMLSFGPGFTAQRLLLQW